MKKYGKLTQEQTIEAFNHWTVYGKRGLNTTKITAMNEMLLEYGWEYNQQEQSITKTLGEVENYEGGSKQVTLKINTSGDTRMYEPKLHLYAPWLKDGANIDWTINNMNLRNQVDEIKKGLKDRGWEENANKWGGNWNYVNKPILKGYWRNLLVHTKGSYASQHRAISVNKVDDIMTLRNTIAGLKNDAVMVSYKKVNRKNFLKEGTNDVDLKKVQDARKTMPGAHGVLLEAYCLIENTDEVYKINCDDTNKVNWWAIIQSATTPVNRPYTEEELIKTVQKNGNIAKMVEISKNSMKYRKFWDATMDILYNFAESAIIESAIYDRNVKEFEVARATYKEIFEQCPELKGIQISYPQELGEKVEIIEDKMITSTAKVSELYENEIKELEQMTPKANRALIKEVQKRIFGQN